MTGLI